MRLKRKWGWRGVQGDVEYAQDEKNRLWYKFLEDLDSPEFWKLVSL
jgi:hypothetical protein